MLKMKLWPGGDSGASWPDGGGLLPQGEHGNREFVIQFSEVSISCQLKDL